jgi:hypothetical protein
MPDKEHGKDPLRVTGTEEDEPTSELDPEPTDDDDVEPTGPVAFS